VAIGEEPGQDFVIEILDLDPISDGLTVAHGLRREPLYAFTTVNGPLPARGQNAADEPPEPDWDSDDDAGDQT
jgi:hypothetical protein